MALAQILLATQVGMDVPAVDTDVVEHAIVQGGQLTRGPAAIASIRDAQAQAGENAGLFALRQPHGASSGRMDLAATNAQVVQFTLVQPRKFAHGFLVEPPSGGLFRALIQTERSSQLPPEAADLLRDELRPQRLRVAHHGVKVVCLAWFESELNGGSFRALQRGELLLCHACHLLCLSVRGDRILQTAVAAHPSRARGMALI